MHKVYELFTTIEALLFPGFLLSNLCYFILHKHYPETWALSPLSFKNLDVIIIWQFSLFILRRHRAICILHSTYGHHNVCGAQWPSKVLWHPGRNSRFPPTKRRAQKNVLAVKNFSFNPICLHLPGALGGRPALPLVTTLLLVRDLNCDD